MNAILQTELWEKEEEILTIKKETELEQERLKKKYEVEKTELEYKKNIADLKKQVAALEEAEQPKKKRAASTTELFKEKDKIDKEVAKRKAIIENSKVSAEEKKTSMMLLDRWREEQCERIENQFGRGLDKDET